MVKILLEWFRCLWCSYHFSLSYDYCYCYSLSTTTYHFSLNHNYCYCYRLSTKTYHFSLIYEYCYSDRLSTTTFHFSLNYDHCYLYILLQLDTLLLPQAAFLLVLQTFQIYTTPPSLNRLIKIFQKSPYNGLIELNTFLIRGSISLNRIRQ